MLKCHATFYYLSVSECDELRAILESLGFFDGNVLLENGDNDMTVPVCLSSVASCGLDPTVPSPADNLHDALLHSSDLKHETQSIDSGVASDISPLTVSAAAEDCRDNNIDEVGSTHSLDVASKASTESPSTETPTLTETTPLVSAESSPSMEQLSDCTPQSSPKKKKVKKVKREKVGDHSVDSMKGAGESNGVNQKVVDAGTLQLDGVAGALNEPSVTGKQKTVQDSSLTSEMHSHLNTNNNNDAKPTNVKKEGKKEGGTEEGETPKKKKVVRKVPKKKKVVTEDADAKLALKEEKQKSEENQEQSVGKTELSSSTTDTITTTKLETSSASSVKKTRSLSSEISETTEKKSSCSETKMSVTSRREKAEGNSKEKISSEHVRAPGTVTKTASSLLSRIRKFSGASATEEAAKAATKTWKKQQEAAVPKLPTGKTSVKTNKGATDTAPSDGKTTETKIGSATSRPGLSKPLHKQSDSLVEPMKKVSAKLDDVKTESSYDKTPKPELKVSEKYKLPKSDEKLSESDSIKHTKFDAKAETYNSGKISSAKSNNKIDASSVLEGKIEEKSERSTSRRPKLAETIVAEKATNKKHAGTLPGEAEAVVVEKASKTEAVGTSVGETEAAGSTTQVNKLTGDLPADAAPKKKVLKKKKPKTSESKKTSSTAKESSVAQKGGSSASVKEPEVVASAQHKVEATAASTLQPAELIDKASNKSKSEPTSDIKAPDTSQSNVAEGVSSTKHTADETECKPPHASRKKKSVDDTSVPKLSQNVVKDVPKDNISSSVKKSARLKSGTGVLPDADHPLDVKHKKLNNSQNEFVCTEYSIFAPPPPPPPTVEKTVSVKQAPNSMPSDLLSDIRQGKALNPVQPSLSTPEEPRTDFLGSESPSVSMQDVSSPDVANSSADSLKPDSPSQDSMKDISSPEPGEDRVDVTEGKPATDAEQEELLKKYFYAEENTNTVTSQRGKMLYVFNI